MITDPAGLLRELFAHAVDAVSAERCVPPHLPPPPRGRTVVLAAGKAAAAMARAVETRWQGPLSGMAVTRYGHGVPCERIEVIEAAHPLPDDAGVTAARRMLELARGLDTTDLVLCLISGGGSALMTLPAAGVTLDDKRAVVRALLRSGATIAEMNCVRKHLSAIKGGRLAAHCHPAPVVTLVVSDVPGDDPATVASGPTVVDGTTFAEARDVLRRYRIKPPRAVREHLEAALDETPKPGDPRLAGARTLVVARSRDALVAAADGARAAGVAAVILGDSIEGEAREVARAFAGIARQVARFGEPAAPPCVLLSGGETTVTVRGGGRGGRNAEFLLALALALGGQRGIHALACDTDGIDGSESNAGAVMAPDSLERAVALGLSPRAALADNDAWTIFAGLGDLVVTGPTRTNVNDFRAIYIGGV